MIKYYRMQENNRIPDMTDQWIIAVDTETDTWSDLAWKWQGKWVSRTDPDAKFLVNEKMADIQQFYRVSWTQTEISEDELFILLL